MSLNLKFQQARNIITRLPSEFRPKLADKCADIKAAEKSLVEKSKPYMAHCFQVCHGLCCRNVDLDGVITVWDFVFMLMENAAPEKTIKAHLALEKPFFAADCVFLQNRTGPCLFPDHIRPSVCLTTFCGRETHIKKEIRQVESAFMKLAWFVHLSRFKAIAGKTRHSGAERRSDS